MTWIQTFTGIQFNILEPTPEMIDIHDIAHALSNLCRFTGHSKSFYSVAQHSYLIAARVPEEDMLAALLHDAPEAYLADISSPVKRLPGFGGEYAKLEARIHAAICLKFGVELDMPHSVREADLKMLVTEKRDLMADGYDWKIEYNDQPVEPYHFTIDPHGPLVARDQFLRTFKKLGGVH
jgi:hypothetical protein